MTTAHTVLDRAPDREIKGRSLWQDAVARLARNHAAVASMILLLFIAIICVLAPLAIPHDLDEIYWDAIQAPPSPEHWFGTDANGRDLMVRVLYGGQISLLVILALCCLAAWAVTWTERGGCFWASAEDPDMKTTRTRVIAGRFSGIAVARAREIGPGGGQTAQAKISRTTLPSTSVRRKSRPA